MNKSDKILLKKGRRRRGQPKRLRILRKSKYMKRWLLRNPWIQPISVFNYASIIIQKVFRGYLVRKRSSKFQRIRRLPSKKKVITNTKPKATQLENYMNYLDKVRSNNQKYKPPWLNGGYSAWCAVKIQSIVRMYLRRRKYILSKRLVSQVASIIIQTYWRNYCFRSSNIRPETVPKKPKKLNTKQQSALKIQLCWRSFCNKRIYRYFRDLVLVKLKGTPADLLRSIIAGEADVLDKAAGIHVKFRLGGAIFPPKVYFKIFTHRPLCDVNAFAPRDYTAEVKQDAVVINNKNAPVKKRVRKTPGIKVGVRYFETILSTTDPRGTDNWYRREENNNWRPIASHMFENISTPPWFQETNHISKPVPFHYSRLQRKEEVEKMKRRRKREWMMKLYGLTADNKQENSNSGKSSKDIYTKDSKEINVKSQLSFYDSDEKDIFNKLSSENDEKDALIKWR